MYTKKSETAPYRLFVYGFDALLALRTGSCNFTSLSCQRTEVISLGGNREKEGSSGGRKHQILVQNLPKTWPYL